MHAMKQNYKVLKMRLFDFFFFRVELIFKDSRKCIDTGYNQSSESSKKQLTILLVVFS